VHGIAKRTQAQVGAGLRIDVFHVDGSVVDRRELLPVPAEQRVHGRSEDPARQVPEREIEEVVAGCGAGGGIEERIQPPADQELRGGR